MQGIQESVFVQVYHDCPEEIDWVYKQFQVNAILKSLLSPSKTLCSNFLSLLTSTQT